MSVVHILPNLRKGLATRISGHDELRAKFDINVQIKGHRAGADAEEKPTLVPSLFPDAAASLSRPFLLAGPVDVQSISKDAIFQVVPEDKSTGFSNGYMPYIEFYDEDFPWRYTPLEASANLNPWLLLLACKEDEFKVETDALGNHRVIIDLGKAGTSPADFYPAPDKFHKAAHVQITAPESIKDDSNQLLQYIREHPDDGVSRLFCLRGLEEDTKYTMFLVPAFELGRLAGIGEGDEESWGRVGIDKLSWDSNAQKRTFPVYYKWTFTSGGRKFMDLAREQFFISSTEFAKLPSSLSADISETGLRGYRVDAPASDDKTPIDIPVALVKKGYTGKSDRREPAAMDGELKELLLKSPVFSDDDAEHPVYEDPWVVPPVYGARHILATPKDLDKDKLFLKDLNLRFSNRAAAGMGAQVVKKNQEQFMNRAWGMVEEVNALNQRVREFYQVLKTNGAADAKTTSLRYYEFPTSVLGLQADAAIRIANAQSAGDINAIDLANDASGKNLNALITAMGDYRQGTGITLDEINEIVTVANWQDKKEEIIKQSALYKFYTDKDLFFTTIDEKYRFLRTECYVELPKLEFVEADDDVHVKLTPVSAKDNERFRLNAGWFFPDIPNQMNCYMGIKNSRDLLVWENDTKWFKYEKSVQGMTISVQKLVNLLSSEIENYKTRWETCSDRTNIHELCYPVAAFFSQYLNPKDSKLYLSETSNEKGFFMKPEVYKALYPNCPNGVAYELKYDKDKTRLIFFPGNKLYNYPQAQYIRFYTDDKPYEHMGGWVCLEQTGSESFRPIERAGLKPNLYDHGVFIKESFTELVMKGRSSKLITAAVNALRKTYPGVLNEKLSIIGIMKKEWKHVKEGPSFVFFDDNNDVLYFIYENNTLYLRGVHISGKNDLLDNGLSEVYLNNDDFCYQENGEFKIDLVRLYKPLAKLYNLLLDTEELVWRPNAVYLPLDPAVDKVFRADDVAGITGKSNETIQKEIESVFDTILGQLTDLRKVIKKENDQVKLNDDQIVVDAILQENEIQDKRANDKKKVVDADQINRDKLVSNVKALSSRKLSMDLMESNFDGKYPVMAAPLFPDPTSFYLRELSEKFLLPSVDDLKPNSISCFMTNPAFEEAFLAGMNTEMGRELLWREYPTDERGSCFRKFWDQDVLPDDFKDGYFDVQWLHNWKGRLGENHADGKGRMTVFVIKSELMVQYPQTGICLAVVAGSKGQEYLKKVLDPVMTGWLSNDTYMAGFYADELSTTEGIFLTFVETDKSQRFSHDRPLDPNGKPQAGSDNVSSEFAVNRSDTGSVWGVEVHPKYLENN